MLDIKYIKQNKDKVAELLAKRVDDLDLDIVLDIDVESKRVTTELEKLQSERNQLSKQIGQLRSKKEDTTTLEAEVQNINNRIKEQSEEAASLKEALLNELAKLPNIPDVRVPEGGKENNQVVKTYGEKPVFNFKNKDHVDLCTDLKLIDYERGVKLGGAGFWLYTGVGAALEWALLNYFCSRHYKDGYTFMLPPHLLLHENGYAAGQFPKFAGEVFHLKTEDSDQDRFLLPTSETAILNVYRDEVLNGEDLPIKAFAYSPCYRSERGSSRTEERGCIRGHQFNKVEMFQFTKPEDSEAALHELIGRAEALMEDLGLHYRTSLLAAKDASASMAITYDIEVWIPSMGIYKEVSSISLANDFQARRAKIRFKRKGAKSTEFLHTLNASGLATSRLLPAIVEQYQQADGSVLIPKPLQPWLGMEVINLP
jgi:seryl-tRNA synthetase